MCRFVFLCVCVCVCVCVPVQPFPGEDICARDVADDVEQSVHLMGTWEHENGHNVSIQLLKTRLLSEAKDHHRAERDQLKNQIMCMFRAGTQRLRQQITSNETYTGTALRAKRSW